MLHNATPHYDNGKHSSQPKVTQKSHICIKNQSCKPCSQSENCCPTISHYNTPFHYDSFSMLTGLSIPYSLTKDHCYMSELSLFPAYVRTDIRSDYPQTRHIGGRPSSHKANLIPQSKRQDTTIIVIPCLCSFTVPSSPSAEPPINKKRTRTLSRKESGSSTNCLVDGTGLEPVTSCTSSRCSTS